MVKTSKRARAARDRLREEWRHVPSGAAVIALRDGIEDQTRTCGEARVRDDGVLVVDLRAPSGSGTYEHPCRLVRLIPGPRPPRSRRGRP